jgi:alkylation response protein AidB-like acyl-CoA dehydrogenase
VTVSYEAPLAMMRLALEQAARLSSLDALAAPAEALTDLAPAILESAARLAREQLSALNRIGDAAGAQLVGATVTTAPGFKEAYRRFCADGWPALAAPTSAGGQGLPMLIAAATTEMWGGANLAFAMCPEAASGAIEALLTHADAPLRETYVPPLASGAWTASMCLTESQAGSDLSTLRTSAEPDGESWRLSGRKVFISWGDHDLTDNIVHLVLARAAGAPPGVKGLSLYLVPKRLPGAALNDIRAIALEHKMGIRGSPTCAMALGEHGGARGWLVGALHGGLECMFTMMNHMRLGVGLHSVGLAERARQLALAYAQERRQGRNAEGAQRPIIEHADVRRMLLTMSVLTHASRCLAYHAAATFDVARAAPSEVERARAARRLALLTPLVKAWCSDTATEVASLGVQVHGGMGYMDDCEISQIYRDSRIGSIYEGTNYIQAQDLLVRKVLRVEFDTFIAWLDEMAAAARSLPEERALAGLRAGLASECAELARGAAQLTRADPEAQGGAAYAFLSWLGIVAGAWQWAETVRGARATPLTQPRADALIGGAAFYAAHVLPRARAFAATATGGASALAGVTPTDLA